MSATRRKRDRRDRTPAAAQGQQPAPQAESRPVAGVMPLPQWKWRTFPVFFALAAGLFLGTWIGSLTGIVAAENDNSLPMNTALIIAAILFGAALSLFATRFMMSRQWVKPRPARPKKR